jgi:hypothetical protein
MEERKERRKAICPMSWKDMLMWQDAAGLLMDLEGDRRGNREEPILFDMIYYH